MKSILQVTTPSAPSVANELCRSWEQAAAENGLPFYLSASYGKKVRIGGLLAPLRFFGFASFFAIVVIVVLSNRRHRLKSFRLAAKMSQEQLGKSLGVTFQV